MISSHEFLRLQEFRKFWVEELGKSPCARYRPKEHVRDIFYTHSKNMVRIGKNIMPSKKQTTSKFDWKGYKNISIPESEVSKLEKLIKDDKNVFYSYNQMLIDEYQIKQYFDAKSESIKTVATCHNADSVNFGYALSAYADDWYTSLACLIFKHFEIAAGDWQDVASNGKRKFG